MEWNVFFLFASSVILFLKSVLLAIAGFVSAVVLNFFHIFAEEKNLLDQSCRTNRLVHTSTVPPSLK